MSVAAISNGTSASLPSAGGHHRPEQHARRERRRRRALSVMPGAGCSRASAHARLARSGVTRVSISTRVNGKFRPPIRVAARRVVTHRLAHDDEEALTQERDALRGVAAERFELALGDLDQRRRVPERAQIALVHHPHVVVAPSVAK